MRIGVHEGEATRAGLGYHGQEIHVAARIGATAEGGEILASSATAELAQATTTEPRTVKLKGVANPIQLVAIVWRADG